MKRILLVVMAIAILYPAVAVGYVIDKVAAVVNGEVITESEVDRALRAEAHRRGVNGEEGLAALRQEVLDSLIDRALILGDARKFNIVDVSDEEVDEAVASVKARYESEDDFLSALRQDGMDMDELRESLANQILAVKYVDRRIRYFVRVTLDDQKKYYAEHVEDFGGRSFAEVYDEIHALLTEKYTDIKLGEYLKDLRARSEIIIPGKAACRGGAPGLFD